MPSRRTLNLTTLDDAVTDAERLHAGGYEPAGKWDLAQVCGHLTAWLTYPLDGYPPLPVFLKPIFWALKNTVAQGMLDKVIRKNEMPAGASTAPQSVPAPGGDPAKAVDAYKTAVARWLSWNGAMHPSPLFGVQPKEKITELHRVHAAHHLSFLVPKHT